MIVFTGDERIELPLKVLETLVIPFDQSPKVQPLLATAYIEYNKLCQLSRIFYKMLLIGQGVKVSNRIWGKRGLL